MQKTKPATKHLVLRTEAIRRLDRTQLEGAIGGHDAGPTTVTQGKVTSAACDP